MRINKWNDALFLYFVCQRQIKKETFLLYLETWSQRAYEREIQGVLRNRAYRDPEDPNSSRVICSV